VANGRAVRDMLRSGEPGPEELYPIAAQLLWLKDYVARSPVLQPVARRYDHKRVYVFGFGGCVWYFSYRFRRCRHVQITYDTPRWHTADHVAGSDEAGSGAGFSS